ncbi:MAG: type II secretion system F family protein [Candidatus Omnitrophica bacterium]|nr:type II secretion system F family protein [Candidatus Omnitrophota bacterium]
MPKFKYKIKKSPNEVIEGTIEAENQDAALNKITQLGHFPLEVKEVKEQRREYHKKKKSFSLGLFRKINPQDIVIFTRQFSDLLDSGLPIVKSLNIIHNQTQNRHLKEIILELGNFVRDGGIFSDGLSRYPRIFSNFYVNMIKSGEISGSLDRVLNRLADFSEKEQETRSKIKTSLAYPTIMALMGVLTVFILLTFVIPKLVIMFVEIGQALPLPTSILINLSSFFAGYWWLIIILVALVSLYLKRTQETQEGRAIIDGFKLGIPLFGDFLKKVEIARFARTLGILLDNGVTIIRSMETVAGVLDNQILRQDVQRMLKDIVDGSSLTKTMLKSRYFPEVVINMVAIGEESGQLEKSLFKIADSYERESDRTVKVITTLLEPITILIIGAVVGFIVVAMLLPIFQMNLMIR